MLPGPYCPADSREACEESWVPITLKDSSNGQAIGTSSLTIEGLAFQLEDPTAQVRVGHTAAEASIWISDTSLNCRVASGSGEGGDLVVTIAVTNDEENIISLEGARSLAPVVFADFLIGMYVIPKQADMTVLTSIPVVCPIF